MPTVHGPILSRRSSISRGNDQRALFFWLLSLMATRHCCGHRPSIALGIWIYEYTCQLQQPRQMLLILRSSAASSRLTGSFGLLRFFSDGTSSARGCRWPIGASRVGWGWFAAPDVPVLLPVCAIAAGAPIRASSAVDMISFRI